MIRLCVIFSKLYEFFRKNKAILFFVALLPSFMLFSATPQDDDGGFIPDDERVEDAAGTEGVFRQADGLVITIEEAVVNALENNRALRVERLNPLIRRTFEEQERALFDMALAAEAGAAVVKPENAASLGRRETFDASAAILQILPFGSTLRFGADVGRITRDAMEDRYSTRAGLSITQSLLRGRGTAVNLANLRQAQLDTDISKYELHGFAEALVAEVEIAYWRYVLAERRVAIVEQSLELAERQLEETRHRIRVGQIAETELAAAKAEAALRQEALINASASVESLLARLLRLVDPVGYSHGRSAVRPGTEPYVPEVSTDQLEEHVGFSLSMRPDINQAELLLSRDDIELVKTRNGLLPRMDLFVNLGKTGYADSFGGSVSDISGDGYDISAALKFEQPVFRRRARAGHERAVFSRQQREESLENLKDLARLDVELAFIEVGRTRKQVDATRITRTFQEEKLRAETAKFKVGKSTALLVAAAQRDLLASQVGEIEALVNHLIAKTVLFRTDGSLLLRRGINPNF